MNSTRWFIGDALATLAGLLAGALSIFSSFQAMKDAESAGIAAVAGNITEAMLGVGLGMVIAAVAFMVGFIQLYREQRHAQR